MSRSNYDKPFYVDVGTSIAAIRCASDGDVIDGMDHHGQKYVIKIIEDKCDRMNREFELYAMQRASSVRPKCDWSVKDALNFANTLDNHGWTREANADAASSCIYALCRLLKDCGNAAAMREAVGDLLYMAERYVQKTPATESIIFDAKTKKEIRTINYYDVIAKAKAALSAPPRNCDVGTADEQEDRFDKFCDSHKWVDDEGANACMSECPLYNTNNCSLLWAQRPYEAEEGGAE